MCLWTLLFIVLVVSWANKYNCHILLVPLELIILLILFILMSGVLLLLLQKVVTNTMLSLLMITLGIPGFTLWSIVLNCYLYISPLFVWFTPNSRLLFAFFVLILGGIFIHCLPSISFIWRHSCSIIMSGCSCTKWCCRAQTSSYNWNCPYSIDSIFCPCSLLGWGCIHCCISHKSTAFISSSGQVSWRGLAWIPSSLWSSSSVWMHMLCPAFSSWAH